MRIAYPGLKPGATLVRPSGTNRRYALRHITPHGRTQTRISVKHNFKTASLGNFWGPIRMVSDELRDRSTDSCRFPLIL